MCRKGGRRCPNSTHGRYNKSKASVKSYKVASERLQEQIVKAHTLTNLKAEQAAIKSSGDAAKLEAHIAEHGTQQEMSKQLWSAREAVENKTRRMVEHSVRVEGKDADELEAQYDENDFHIATGIHRRTFAHRDDYMEVEGELYNRHTGHHARRDEKYGEYLSTVDPSSLGDADEVRTFTKDELEDFYQRARSGNMSEEELRCGLRGETIHGEQLTSRDSSALRTYSDIGVSYLIARAKRDKDASVAKKWVEDSVALAQQNTAAQLALTPDKEVRSKVARNDSSNEYVLGHLARFDRSKHIKAEARATLVRRMGEEEADFFLAHDVVPSAEFRAIYR